MSQNYGPRHGGGHKPNNAAAHAAAAAALSGERQDAVLAKRIPRALIDPDPLQPRTRFDPEKLAELRASIEDDGQQSPIKVVPVGARYRVLWGHRRYWAMEKFELMDVIVESSKLNQQKILELQLAENIQREELSLADICRAILRFQEDFKQPYSYLASNIFRPLAKGNPEWVGDRARAWKRADEPLRALMERHDDVLSHVEIIAPVQNKALRGRMIEAVEEGASVSDLRAMLPKKEQPAPLIKARSAISNNGGVGGAAFHGITTHRQDAPETESSGNSYDELIAQAEADAEEEATARIARLQAEQDAFDFADTPDWGPESLSITLANVVRTLEGAHQKMAMVKTHPTLTPLAKTAFLRQLALIEASAMSLRADLE